jgi:winged helix-turn-helix protein DUF2582
MEAEIGYPAGAIWQYLDEHGVTTLSKLRQGTKLPDQLLLLVGPLAYIDKPFDFDYLKRVVAIALQPQTRQPDNHSQT